MDGDSDELEDYNLTEKDDGILPRTGAEERRMVDDNNDQDMSAFETTQGRESETLSIVPAEQTLSTQSLMEDRLIEEGLKLRQLICRDAVQSQRPISMQAPSRSLAEILQLIPKDDARQVIEGMFL
jgi:hypothetical protein